MVRADGEDMWEGVRDGGSKIVGGTGGSGDGVETAFGWTDGWGGM